MAGRTIWAGLQLLDRQMLARGGKMAGCVDDLELTPSDEDPHRFYVTAIVSGPGSLLYRLNRHRAGAWLQEAYRRVKGRDQDPVAVPFGRVTQISSWVELDIEEDELASVAAEHWVRDHVISHVPWSGHAAE